MKATELENKVTRNKEFGLRKLFSIRKWRFFQRLFGEYITELPSVEVMKLKLTSMTSWVKKMFLGFFSIIWYDENFNW